VTATGTLEELARRAIDGERDALDGLVRGLQPDIYGIAVRMLWNREDAEDATQEVLVRVVTRLSRFDFRSGLRTWVYRIAVNCILDVKKSPVERMRLTFEQFGDELLEGLSTDGPQDAERSVLIEEVKIGCTLGMLQCLDRPHRIAYTLGEIMELTGTEAGAVLNISPALFRKRLERAREAIARFTREHCGLLSDSAACQCNRCVATAVRLGRVNPERPNFASQETSFEEARAIVRRVEDARRPVEVHRTNRPRESPADLARRVVAILERSAERRGSRDDKG
jgi:RNA polymerase sigma factor (sigma-70 family)